MLRNIRAHKMVEGRLSALVALLLLGVLGHSIVVADECKESVMGVSGIIGSKQQGAVMVDHSSLADKGPIKRVSLYYSKELGCLKAIKAAFGNPPVPGVIGNTADATERALKLEAGEHIVRAEYKAGKCIQYMKLTTNKGHHLAAGRVGPVADLMTSAPTEGNGQLLAIKGSSKPVKGKKQGALQHLQLVWGSTKCTSASTVAEGTLMAESGTLTGDDTAAAGAVTAGACQPRLDMCNEKASMNAFTYCVWNAPFSGPNCKGGCCFSSGKCASSSCAISGMGRDVGNMICYGANTGVGLGGNSNCAGLACKLAVPGCSTDAFGGNCVGTVVAFAAKDSISAESQRFIGAPCLDATPSDTTLNAAGAPASGEEGIYMGKLWTICDCSEGGIGLPATASRLLNLTTTRISNFTKNEVLAAFSTLLPQKNATDEAAPPGKSKVVTLLPSFADMFKLPSLSSINLPNLIGNLTGSKAGKDSSLALPKLPALPALLQQIKPAHSTDDQTAAKQPTLNFESGSLPNATEAESAMMETPGFAPEKPAPRTLGDLFKSLKKPKEQSNGDGSSTFTPGSTGTDGDQAAAAQSNKAASTKVRPMTLGALLGGLRKAGPDNSTTASAASPAAGNSTKKLDLSPIGALITKFINGPSSTPAANTTTNGTTTTAAAATPETSAAASAPQSAVPAATPAQTATPAPTTASAVPAQQGSGAPVQQQTPKPAGQAAPSIASPGATGMPASAPVPAPASAPVPAPAPAQTPAQMPAPAQAPAAAPAAAPTNTATTSPDSRIPGGPKDNEPTLSQQLAARKAAKRAAKAAAAEASPSPAPGDVPERQVVVRKSGFTGNVNVPHMPRAWEEPQVLPGGINLMQLMGTIAYLTQLLTDKGAGARPEDIAQVTELLTKLQQIPGGLSALPPDVTQALMILAAEMNRVTAEAAAAQPGSEAAASPASTTPAPTPTATPTPTPTPTQAQAASAPAASSANVGTAAAAATKQPTVQASTSAAGTAQGPAHPTAAAEAAVAKPAASAPSAAEPAKATTAATAPTATVPKEQAVARTTAVSEKPASAVVSNAEKPVAARTATATATASDKPTAVRTATASARPTIPASVAAHKQPAAVGTSAKPAETAATAPPSVATAATVDKPSSSSSTDARRTTAAAAAAAAAPNATPTDRALAHAKVAPSAVHSNSKEPSSSAAPERESTETTRQHRQQPEAPVADSKAPGTLTKPDSAAASGPK